MGSVGGLVYLEPNNTTYTLVWYIFLSNLMEIYNSYSQFTETCTKIPVMCNIIREIQCTCVWFCYKTRCNCSKGSKCTCQLTLGQWDFSYKFVLQNPAPNNSTHFARIMVKTTVGYDPSFSITWDTEPNQHRLWQLTLPLPVYLYSIKYRVILDRLFTMSSQMAPFNFNKSYPLQRQNVSQNKYSIITLNLIWGLVVYLWQLYILECKIWTEYTCFTVNLHKKL